MADMPRVNAASDLILGRKCKVYVEGYEIQVATAMTPGITSEDSTAHVYGSDEPLTASIVTGSTLSITVLERANNNVLLEVLSGLRPEDEVLKEYKWAEFREVSVIINVKHPTEDRYCACGIFNRWRPAPGDRAMAPTDWMSRTFVGGCDTSKWFSEAAGVGIRIEQEKLALTSSGAGAGYTATLSKTPVKAPSSEINVLRVLIIDGTAAGAVNATDEINIDSNTCGDGSTTVWVDNDELQNTKGKADYALVAYLVSGSGTADTDGTFNMDGLWKAM